MNEIIVLLNLWIIFNHQCPGQGFAKTWHRVSTHEIELSLVSYFFSFCFYSKIVFMQSLIFNFPSSGLVWRIRAWYWFAEQTYGVQFVTERMEFFRELTSRRLWNGEKRSGVTGKVLSTHRGAKEWYRGMGRLRGMHFLAVSWWSGFRTTTAQCFGPV